jgi:hypothetical protein
MSNARKISDHGFWAGGASAGSVFPAEKKVKMESSAEGAGHESYYEDKTEDIKNAQSMGSGKLKSHKQKDNYRN